MNKAETVAGLAFAALGIFVGLESARWPYLLDGVPGPGFLPRWIAIGLIAAGIVLTTNALRARAAPLEPIEWPERRGWRRIGLMLGALAVSLLLLEKLGFLVTTALFMAVVIFGLGVRSWLMLASVPLLAAIGLYVVFAVWLSVPLPKGILDFFG
jgi:putative tricarboxylic transport membrane protein